MTSPQTVAAAPRHVAIVNVVASNTGDAAILASLIRCLHGAFGDALTLTIHDSQPDVVRRLYPELDVRGSGHLVIADAPLERRLGRLARRLHRARLLFAARWYARGRSRWAGGLLWRPERALMQELLAYDLVVSTGGTYLVESYRIFPRLLYLEIVLALRRPLLLYTQSLGPFANPDHRRQVRRILDGAELVLLRDERSRENLQQLGAKLGRTRVRPDGAFVLAEPDRPAAASGQARKVAVSVRDWPHHAGGQAGNRRYRAAVAAAVTALVGREIEVVFLSTCQGVPEYPSDDSACAAEVMSLLPGEVAAHCVIDSDFHHPQSLIETLKRFDALISTRMHGAILALGAGVPTLPIAYEFKTAELFTDLGLGHWVTDIEDIEPRAFSALALRFIDELDTVREAMRRPVLAARAGALATADDMRMAVGG